jgi:hypothetical protein
MSSLMAAASRAFWRHQQRMREDMSYRTYVVRLVEQGLRRLGASTPVMFLRVFFRAYLIATPFAAARHV